MPASRGLESPLPPLIAGGVSTGTGGLARDGAEFNSLTSY